MSARTSTAGTLTLAALLLLGACTASPPPPSAATSTPAQPVPSGTAEAGSPSPSPGLPVRPVGDPVVIASGLNAPWSILHFPNEGTLISERDTTLVRELLPDGALRDAGRVAEARPGGEGGLLGLAALPDPAAPGGTGWVYAYLTGADDNRIVRMPLFGSAGSHTLGDAEPVLDAIPKAGNHNGGRLAFGPDDLLYATAGDAGDSGNAQDPASLGGKILRMTPTGAVPDDNPFGTLVYSSGHRNPQGIAWDSTGQLWASEFGQNTWDELNRITAGGNYGWPVVEGMQGTDADPGFIDPVQQWPTSEASPSGLAIVNDTIFMAALRGERLWRFHPSTGEVDDWFVNSFGRLRDVVPGPDGTLWFVSNNTDGRGTPSPGDDRLYQVAVAP
ncbi:MULTISPECIES: PQQ-dependent sugar dehydrogenase [Cryobacterium]|uniref:PQQ-dependent sugar dehydrogenase n=1 Tax=Cryobacterium breve TaxID=1259258 RepID=A0ABY2J083_9MICO|nr:MULTISPECIES: PQQ-dependent sugar dehydrogenase [Cryobacterium]TFC91812.1 PQQ-dependent sugar dehydrogenase [Cryobacterium sp. TmT3-12]TFC98362.1 PQQ-dependent sugar dehydrogenase [Cryobacterium breve]